MNKNELKEVSKQQLGRIRNKIEDFKRKQKELEISNNLKLYVSTNKALEIYQTIDAIQQIPPHNRVTKKEVAVKKLNIQDRQIRRGLELLCKVEALKSLEEGQYWIPKYLEKKMKYLRKENKRKNKIIEEQKRIQKRLIEENIATVEMAKPYLDNLKYCDSDQDWELLTKWFMKMQENKHYHVDAESWEKLQKDRAEIMRKEMVANGKEG